MKKEKPIWADVKKVRMTDFFIGFVGKLIKAKVLFRVGDIVDAVEYKDHYSIRASDGKGYYRDYWVGLDKAVVVSKWAYRWHLFKNLLKVNNVGKKEI